MRRTLGTSVVALALTAGAGSAAAQPSPWDDPPPPKAERPAAAEPAPAAPGPSAEAPGPAPDEWGPQPGQPRRRGLGSLQRLQLYDSAKKDPLLALVGEFFIPGFGSVYADHAIGAAVTWGCMIAGLVFLIKAFDEQDNQNRADAYLLGGLALIGGGRIYGFVDSYSSANDYNQRLREKLGVPAWASLRMSPIRAAGGGIAFAPSLELRF